MLLLPCSTARLLRYCGVAGVLLTIQMGGRAPVAGQAPPMQRAMQLLQANKLDSALVITRDIVAADSSNGRAWNLMGTVLLRLGRTDDALGALRRARMIPAAEPLALYNSGLVFGRMGQMDSAFAYMDAAKRTGRVNVADIDIDPDAAPLRGDARYPGLKPTAAELARPFAENAIVLHEFRGSAMNEQFGWIARSIGDVDGDRVEDFVTSAPNRTTTGANGGAVLVYSSRAGTLLWKADGAPGDLLGQGIEAAGDVNRDGIPDVIGSAPGAGKAYVYSGRDGAVLHTFTGENRTDGFGAHVDGTGDVNRDGYADVIVGAPGHAANGTATGRVYIYSGRDGALLHTLTGPAAGARFGAAVAGWSDAHRSLIVVGAPGDGPRGTGRVYVYGGLDGTPRFTFDSDSTGSALGGMFVTIAGDVDGDGTPDVYASDWPNTALGRSTGRVYVLSGSDGHVIRTHTGEAAGDGFGTSSSKAGDVNGDGHADLVVGAWQHASKAVAGGKVYLYSGRDGALLRTWTGTVPGETLGFDAVAIGDVNGDSLIDFLLTSAWSSVAGSHSGRVLIVSGAR